MQDKVVAIVFYLAVFSLTACNWDVKDSNQVSQSGISQSYRVTYNEPAHHLSSWAQFTNGSGGNGESIDLQAPSQVTFDGRSTRKEAVFGISYETESHEAFTASHSWTYIDGNGKSYVS